MNDCTILCYEFPGNNVGRGKFLSSCIEGQVVPFIEKESFHFIRFVLEVIKNIYDHAEGRGRLILLKRGRVLEFEIKDHGQKAYDLNEIKKRGSALAGNGTNYGCGICGNMIEDIAEALGIEYTLDTSKGFCFHGNFDPERL